MSIPVPLGLGVVFVLSTLLLAQSVSAETREELERAVSEHNTSITALDQEIEKYEKELTNIGSQKQTLQSTVNGLEIQRKQLQAKISATKNKIGALELEIKQLNQDIDSKGARIGHGKDALRAIVRTIDQNEKRSLVETVLGDISISSVWTSVEEAQQFQDAMHEKVEELVHIKITLTEQRASSEKKRNELSTQRKTLVAQEQSLSITAREQKSLLAQTKEKESAFQELLEEKRVAKIAFENALEDLESELKYIYDPNVLPKTGGGILEWPLDAVKVTQYFGNTKFARSGAYSGRGHNGIDLRAPIGTPIKAAFGGVVEGTGNSDSVRGCYSYGKWILLRHPNGLSTLYAHLSHVGVETGSSVSTGVIIGYSGFTGYATGPHLHFGVYASDGVKIVRLGDVTKKLTPCSNAIIPVSSFGAYLNPMDYLE